jgi:acetoin utilization protein AcuB
MAARVGEWMSGDPISIDLGASALEAYETMLRNGIRHLPVVEGNGNLRVIGVLTADDLAAGLALPARPHAPLAQSDRRSALESGVGELMTYAPRTIARDATVAEAAAQMALGHFGCLPVVDREGRLEGIVTETDLLYALASLEGGPAMRERRSDALAALVSELEDERARIAQELDRYHSVERELTRDTRESPMDMPERSAEQGVVSLTSSLDGLATRRLAAIDRALDHARRGRLSVCDSCGGPISLPRLRALPGTTLCIDCARRAEAG